MRYELFINGEWVKDSNQEYFPAINPYTQEVWAEVPQATEAQVAKAIDAPWAKGCEGGIGCGDEVCDLA